MSEILQGVWQAISSIFANSGYAYFFTNQDGWKNLVMLCVAFFFLWLGAEPMLEKLDRIKTKYGLAE